ncbi:hypothetical protein GYMLUDRAFT_65166 [Collybiopsis luxurians FD-317 M1]|uniref:Uncharacterized protein n=1 Tax=Collybiopsis luxurians FD-317 M1 TaxID=944289 RepID=A0A0D0C7F8_9AGAR|nr:hypothetical protein GYMLUDRAFT_65166 [Collybiopsis luxurians FD-317 M1]
MYSLCMWHGTEGPLAEKILKHVPASQVTSALYRNAPACCLIWLEKYKQPHMIQTEEEDFSINPTSLPFDTETCKALFPHQQVLHSLAFDSGNITDTSYVPVLNQTQLTFEKKH